GALRSRLRQVVQGDLREAVGREEQHRGHRRQYRPRRPERSRRGRGLGAKRPRPVSVRMAAAVLRRAGRRHKDVYAECEKKYGKPIDLAIKSTYNPKTKKYFGFS